MRMLLQLGSREKEWPWTTLGLLRIESGLCLPQACIGIERMAKSSRFRDRMTLFWNALHTQAHSS